MTANSLGQFAEKMRTMAINIQANALELQKDIAYDILTHVASATPIDTGKAMSNWVVGSGSPEHFEYESLYPGEFGSTADEVYQAVLDLNIPEIEAHKSGPIHITNSASHITALNDGDIEPREGVNGTYKHFVEIAVMEALQESRRRVLSGVARKGSR